MGSKGQIYTIDRRPSGGPVTQPFVDLVALGLNLGPLGTDAARGLTANAGDQTFDASAYAAVGKQGLGDVEVDPNGQAMYVTDLYNRQVIALDLAPWNSSATAPTSYAVLHYPATTCNLGKDRPFGLGYNRGERLVGVVCTAEDGGATADMRAIVYAFSPATTVWRSLLNVSLDYTKGAAFDINNAAFVKAHL